MKNRWIITLALVALCGMAQASLVSYYITGATGDNWSGQFDVADLNVSASDNSGNTLSVSADGWSPLAFNYFGSGGGGWLCWTDEYGNGLTFVSPDLNNFLVAGGEWNTTWNDLIGNSYGIISLEYQKEVTFVHPDEGSLSGTGGQISFAAIPEPATALTLMLGGLLITGYRRMRKSYGHF